MGRCILYKKIEMISIVTGTLDRLDYLKMVIDNTVNSNKYLELVLVDGGSTDGTIEYIKSLNHDRIKFIECGKRSYYWHYMNLGIENSSHEWVCQWNDDVIMETHWDLVIQEISKEANEDFYIFSWRGKNDKEYVIYDDEKELVLNYGIYNKKIFREIGMYDTSYKYYYCDGDLSFRAKEFGFSYKKMYNVKCKSLTGFGVEKKAILENNEIEYSNYLEKLSMYKNKNLPHTLVKLTR
jgi:glycosyltransferase involved in cell wall biosynthesis